MTPETTAASEHAQQLTPPVLATMDKSDDSLSVDHSYASDPQRSILGKRKMGQLDERSPSPVVLMNDKDDGIEQEKHNIGPKAVQLESSPTVCDRKSV